MRFLIMLEPTEVGFAVQVPDLAISTYGESLERQELLAVGGAVPADRAVAVGGEG